MSTVRPGCRRPAARGRGLRAEGLRAQVSSGFERRRRSSTCTAAAPRASARTSSTRTRTTWRCSRPAPVHDARRALRARRVLRADRLARPVPASSPQTRRVAALPPLDVSQRGARPGAAAGGRVAARGARREAAPLTFVVSLRLGEPAVARAAAAPPGSLPDAALQARRDELVDARADRRAGRHRRGRLGRLQGASIAARSSTSQPDPVLYRRVVDGLPRRLARGPRRGHAGDRRRARRRPRADHLGRADPLDRRHRVAAVRAADGQHQAVADRRPAPSSAPPTTTAPSAGSAPTAAASSSSAPVAARPSTWRRCFTPTRPTTWRRSAFTRTTRAPGLPSSPLARRARPTVGFSWDSA